MTLDMAVAIVRSTITKAFNPRLASTREGSMRKAFELWLRTAVEFQLSAVLFHYHEISVVE